jgi:putative endonuclease
MTYYIYILYSVSIDRYYVGYSSDPWHRLEQYLSNSKDKYTGKADDWFFSAVFEVSTRESDAIRVERFIKKQKSNRSLFQYISIIKISLLPQNQPANSFDFVFFPNHSNINMLKMNGNSIFGLIKWFVINH